ncbi:hypothetical protein FB451DRAFT_1452516 [Mycena latifolia]|nr:hypothetical protein FB451DRAFT_1452516 [Mycena latifolia]
MQNATDRDHRAASLSDECHITLSYYRTLTSSEIVFHLGSLSGGMITKASDQMVQMSIHEAEIRQIHGFDALFANQIAPARTAFQSDDTPFHLLGLGVCAFLEAALGMESGLMGEAARLLTLPRGVRTGKEEATATDASPPASSGRSSNADTVVLLGLTRALSESYMGYFQCMYALNAAHGKFTRAGWRGIGRRCLRLSLLLLLLRRRVTGSEAGSVMLSANASTATLALPSPVAGVSKLFGRWGNSSSVSVLSKGERECVFLLPPLPSVSPLFFVGDMLWGWISCLPLTAHLGSGLPCVSAPFPAAALPSFLSCSTPLLSSPPLALSPSLFPDDRAAQARAARDRLEAERSAEGPVEERIVAGTAFRFGLFNLVFSLLPKKVQ